MNASRQPAVRQTPLGAVHAALGGSMVDFAGYSLPVRYAAGIVNEHTWTRESASLFDVSHMGQMLVTGAQAAAALESLMALDLIALPPGRQQYAVLTNERGGIIDDLIVANLGDAFALIVNAACKAGDYEYIVDRIGSKVRIERLEDRALIALQGPQAVTALARLSPDVADLSFMDIFGTTLLGARCLVSRSGYTGEDGFEISVPADKAEALAEQLLDMPEVRPAGLGARDSLRLEAGLCLYGHDLDTETTPIEAGLAFTIQRTRRPGGARAGGYPGHEIVAQQLKNGTVRRRVGLQTYARVPVREGAEVFAADGARVGTVTSGSFGPTVGAPVAMAYVATPHSAMGTPLTAQVRGKGIDVIVRSLPAVRHRYIKSAE